MYYIYILYLHNWHMGHISPFSKNMWLRKPPGESEFRAGWESPPSRKAEGEGRPNCLLVTQSARVNLVAYLTIKIWRFYRIHIYIIYTDDMWCIYIYTNINIYIVEYIYLYILYPSRINSWIRSDCDLDRRIGIVGNHYHRDGHQSMATENRSGGFYSWENIGK